MGRFDYIRYDEKSLAAQERLKKLVLECEDAVRDIVRETPIKGINEAVHARLETGRAVSLALTCLEEFYMWTGKAIRDNQIARTGKVEFQEERKNG